jgi:Flp pilus assembly protein TadG
MDHAPSLKRGCRQRGDSIVEFALLAPLLIVMLFGVLELGRVVDAWLVVHNAAREGARAAVLVYADTPAIAAAQSTTSAYLSSGFVVRGDIASTSVPSVQVTSDSIAVTAQADVRLYTPVFQNMLGGQVVHVLATASMRRQ